LSTHRDVWPYGWRLDGFVIAGSGFCDTGCVAVGVQAPAVSTNAAQTAAASARRWCMTGTINS
jgi:hypothetical protein